MSRIQFAANLLKDLPIQSVLDVGCRQGELADHLIPDVTYDGADLVADPRGRVTYLGDIAALNIDRSYDAVVALDILEHLEAPSLVFDRLADFSTRYLLVSFPNCYDLKSRVRFAGGGHLGGKYQFVEEAPIDRHRWLMNRQEIVAFYEAKGRKHNMAVQVQDLTYGSSGGSSFVARSGRALSTLLPRSVTSETVFGLFTKGARA